MKNSTLFMLLLALTVVCNSGISQTVDPPYEIGTWLGFRPVAVSYTFDDGCANQFDIAVPMFNEYGFKMTLFTVTSPSWTTERGWEKLQDAADAGHEVASHTVTHTSFSGMDDETQEAELKDSQDHINANISGQRCITMAYPYCNVGNRSICEKYYIAARGCSGQVEKSTPTDFMNTCCFLCGTNHSIKTTEHFISKCEAGINSNGWTIFLIHGIDDDGGYSPVTSDVLRGSLDYLDANRNTYWEATYGNVAQYIKERNSASVTESSADDNTITVQVTDTLDNEIFNVPITVRRPLPDGWLSADVTQNGHLVTKRVVEIDQALYIMFDVVPDSGDVIIAKSDDTGIMKTGSLIKPAFSLSHNYPNPFNPETVISYSLPSKEFVALKIVNLAGKEVAQLVNSVQTAGVHQITWNAEGLPSGVYFYTLQAGSYMKTMKLVLKK